MRMINFARVICLALCTLVPLAAVGRSWPESDAASVYSEGTRLPYAPMGGTDVRREVCSGDTTTLEMIQTTAKIPQHDVDMGRTRLILRSKDTRKVLLEETLCEIWQCLGYNPRTHRYLATSKNEHGVKVTLRGLVYVNERSAKFQDSVFYKAQFHAVSSLYSSQGGYLALIGWRDIAGEHIKTRLYALDTNTDQLRDLGAPPAPPPLEPEFRKTRDDIEMMGPWIAPERHYTELELFVWSFPDPSTLRVTYGPDTLVKRSKRRTERRWNLKKLFAR